MAPHLAQLAAAAAMLMAAPAAALEPVGDFGANPGELDLFVHVPAGLAPGAPLVVALHGCTQDAAAFDDETGLEALADAVPFLLLLPQQRAANNAQRCFNWFEPEDIRPGAGESGSLTAMIDWALEAHAGDPARVFVLGLSAGGAMTAVLMANAPERIAGGGIIAGTPFACNRPTWLTGGWWWWLRTAFGEAAAASFACGLGGLWPADRSAADWGAAVRAAAPGEPTRWPVVSLWQGDADGIVHPDNQRELIEQWTHVHGIDAVADATTVDPEQPIERRVFTDQAGVARVEAWRLQGFGHAVPVDPDGAPEPCGAVAPFIEDANLCAVRHIVRFWGLVE